MTKRLKRVDYTLHITCPEEFTTTGLSAFIDRALETEAIKIRDEQNLRWAQFNHTHYLEKEGQPSEVIC